MISQVWSDFTGHSRHVCEAMADLNAQYACLADASERLAHMAQVVWSVCAASAALAAALKLIAFVQRRRAAS